MLKRKKEVAELTKEQLLEGRECAGFNLKMATRAVQNFFDNAFRSVGLVGTQYTVLSHIFIAGPIPLTKLAGIMYVDRTTLGRNLKPLYRRGLVQMKQGSDRREKLICITDTGIEVLSKALPVWRETQKKIKDIIGDVYWDIMISNLKKLTHNL